MFSSFTIPRKVTVCIIIFVLFLFLTFCFVFFYSVYYFRERISLYSCDIVERRTNLLISTSHGLLNLQATIPSAISRFVMLLLCQFPSLSVHDSAVRTSNCIAKSVHENNEPNCFPFLGENFTFTIFRSSLTV
jgi:hypothetical protein